MKRSAYVCLLVSGLVIPPDVALADSGYYFGTGFSYQPFRIRQIKSARPMVRRKRAALDLVLGYKTETETSFYGAEINIERFLRGRLNDAQGSADCSAALTDSFYCSRRATYRLRGIYGRKIGKDVEAYVALGVGMMKGRGALDVSRASLGINAGITLGMGLQFAVGRQSMLRGEITHDTFNVILKHPKSEVGGTDYYPSYEATTVKVSYIISF